MIHKQRTANLWIVALLMVLAVSLAWASQIANVSMAKQNSEVAPTPSMLEDRIKDLLLREVAEGRLRLHGEYSLIVNTVEIKGNLATIICSQKHKATDQPVPTEGILVLARRVNGTWEIAFKGTHEFNSLLSEMPDALVPVEVKALYLSPSKPPEGFMLTSADYKLPYRCGEEYHCTQGNDQGNHVDKERYAFDFDLPPGSAVVAARRGTVSLVKENSDKCCCSLACANDGNYVVIDHGDGTSALYLHLQHGGVLVNQGDTVEQGQPIIGTSGNTGYTCNNGRTGCAYGVLHFQVQYTGSWYEQSIPISFSDVTTNNGIPASGELYKSGNCPSLSHTKLFNLWLPRWYYLISTGDSRVTKVLLDGSLLFEKPACAKALWISGGSHTLTIWYEASGSGIPIVDIKTWPFVSPACAAQPEEPPPFDPNPYPTTDNATFVSDITLPDDGPPVSPGQALIKTWRLRNTGTSTWGAGYQLAFIGGDQMGAPGSVNLPRSAAPGEEVDISVNMTAPSAGGNYQGNWRMRNAQGIYFGDQIWVKISVPGGPPGGTGDITIQSVEYPSIVAPGQSFRPRVTVKVNQGQLLQSRGDMLRNTDGNLYGAWPHVAVVGTVNAGQTYTFEFYQNNPITAPSGEGTYQSKWRVWRDGNWAGPEVDIHFDVRSGGGTRPNPPTPVSPSNWYFARDGSTPTLCAQSGSSNVQYDFQIYESAQNAESGWISGNCWTPPTLGPYTYHWHVKVRDTGTGLESDWSETWHFSIAEQQLRLDDFQFQPSSPSAAERVRVWTCLHGFGEVNIGLKIEANTATDGSASGDWYWIHHLGTFCYPQDDPTKWPEWETLPLADGTHLIRATGFGPQGQTTTKDATYTLLRRRPPAPGLLHPIQSIKLNSRTVTFRWTTSLRTNQYQLLVSTNPDPAQNPIVNVPLDPSTTSYTYTFNDDYPSLAWRVIARNELGESEATGDFGIDRTPPSSAVNVLAPVTYDTKFTVSWGGSDNLSGIRWYNVQYRDGDRGDWTDWQVGVEKTVDIFTGQPGHTYYFRAQALDRASNLEDYPGDNGDTLTKVDPAAKPPTPWWNSGYAHKRNVLVLNNDNHTLPTGYPVRLHFDGSTTPSATEMYNASLSAVKGDDFRIIYNNSTELSRWVQTFSSSRIDIWFKTQADIGDHASNGIAYQLYYGNAGATNPPADIDDVMPPGKDANTMGLWHFADRSGSTFVDTSGRGHNGNLPNTHGWGDDSFGPYIEWYGGGDGAAWGEVASSSDFDLNELTMEAWVYPTSGGTTEMTTFYRPLASPDNCPGYSLKVSDMKIDLQLNCAAGRDIDGQLALDRWYHIAATFDGSNMRIYRNGSLIRTVSYSQAVRSTAGRSLYLGGTPWSQTFKGRVRHARISNIARSDFSYAANIAAITVAPSLAVGDPVLPPATGSPDLTVLSLTTYPNPSGGVLVQAVVQNTGTVPTRNGFFTDLYANHLPTGAGDYTGSIHFWVASPIEATQTVTLTTIITSLSGIGGMGAQGIGVASEVSSTLYTQVDSTGAVSEPDNLNNIAGGTEVCIASADSYEPDNTAATARLISVNTTEAHNFYAVDDQDWFKFEARAGNSYIIQTANLGLNSDTYLYLYGTDGTTMLAANDDYGGTLASKITWQAPANGTYYVMVKHWNPNVGGCGTSYELSVTLFGDFDRNCVVDVADIQQVASRWRCKCTDTCYNSCYDIDGDCDIDIVDIMLVAVHWGDTCGVR